MQRDLIKTLDYFNFCVEFYENWIEEDREAHFDGVEGMVMNASGLANKSVLLCAFRYSRGDSVSVIGNAVAQCVEFLRFKKNTLKNSVLEEKVRQMYERLDLGTLYESLSLLAFMVSLRFPVAEIRRVLELIGHPGEDMMLDQVAHIFGDASRKIAPQSKFPKVYKGLTDVIGAPPEQRPAQLKNFVEGWYRKMKPISWHNSHLGAEGAYFGYWCFEAALIAMLFNIDDTAVLDHPNYPGDLTRNFRAASG